MRFVTYCRKKSTRVRACTGNSNINNFPGSVFLKRDFLYLHFSTIGIGLWDAEHGGRTDGHVNGLGYLYAKPFSMTAFFYIYKLDGIEF
jgi:hypothetical protein